MLFIAPFSQLEHVPLYAYKSSYGSKCSLVCSSTVVGTQTRDSIALQPHRALVQFFRMKKVFTGQHFHRIAFDSVCSK